jgi:hypothetical protein
VLSIAPGAARMPRRAIHPRLLSPLMQEYASSRSYMALYESLRASDPRSAEENYILAQLLEQCAKFPGIKDPPAAQRWKLGGADSRERFIAALADDDPNRGRRIAAFDAINFDRCGTLSDLSSTYKEVRGLLESAAAEGDPKARARLVERQMRDMMLAPDGRIKYDPANPPSLSELQLEVLRQSVQSADPHAVMNAFGALTAWSGNLTMRAGDSQVPMSASALYAASTLAACDLGMPCGAESPEVLRGCAMHGQCDASDYRDYMFFYSLAPASAQLAGEYHLGILRAVHGDWSYFTFHRVPSPGLAPFQSR